MILAHKQTAILCAACCSSLLVHGDPSGVGRMVDNNEMAGADVKLCILCTSLGECCPNGCPRAYTDICSHYNCDCVIGGSKFG